MASASGFDAFILQYLAGDLSLDDTVTQITAPVNSAYTSGDSGNAIRKTETIPPWRRPSWSEDQVRAQWDEPPLESDTCDDTRGTESQLSELWSAVMYAAKRNPWRNDDNDAHGKLIALVAAIQQAPDPPMPANATKALRQNWIWSSGTLWSTLLLLGPTTREIWNDAFGAAFGHETAIAEWANVNAFMARLTAEKLDDYPVFAIWAMGYALDENQKNSKGNWRDATMPAAAAWIDICGRQMYEWREDILPEHWSIEDTPWPWWPFWKHRFEEISLGGEQAKDETRVIAREAFHKMEEIEAL
ncbi:hypothetical protein K438DRAFT_1825727 [Mycena galopus ATCC 62051]|nr:hypothetical protein K438DRAFT_1825727 [Mycena galopus ATCC 62051]